MDSPTTNEYPLSNITHAPVNPPSSRDTMPIPTPATVVCVCPAPAAWSDLARAWPRTARRMALAITRVLATALVLAASLLCPAGAARADAGRWDRLATPLFDHLGLKDGLPHPLAMALAQDGDGFIWVGTQRGLARWDGYRMRSYLHDGADAHSLPADFVQSLHVDRRGRLWVGSASAGLARFDKLTEQFIRVGAGKGGLAGADVNAIASDADGGLFVGSSAGLDFLDGASQVTHLRSEAVRALFTDRKGWLWIGTASGILRRDPASGAITAVAVNSPSGMATATATPASSASAPWQDMVLSFAENSRGDIAFGTLKSGIGIIEAGASSAHVLELGDVRDVQANMVLAIAEVTPGRWWATTYGGGIVEVDADALHARRILHQPAVPTSLANDRTAALLRDSSGVMWVANERGIDFHNPANRAVDTVYGATGQLEAAVSTAMTDSAGRIWLGLADQGVDLVMPGGERSAALRPDPVHLDTALPNRMVLAIAEAEPQEAWIGTQLGLYHTERHGEHARRVALPQANPYPRVGNIVVQGEALWLGTFAGLLRYEPVSGALRTFSQGPTGLTDNRIQVISAAPGGVLWVGTRNGLNRLDLVAGTIEQIVADPATPGALNDAVITALVTDRQGRLWVGTHGGGIGVLERGGPGARVFRRLGVEQGMPSASVAALSIDHLGRIWASTADGLAVVDSQSFKVRALGHAEGVGMPTFFQGAATVTPEQDLVFGATSGMVVVHPDRLGDWNFRAPLAVAAVRLGGRRVWGVDTGNGIGSGSGAGAPPMLRIAPDDKSFEVEMALLDYTASERSSYAYRLEGYDADWIESDSSRRVAAYSNLPPGHYRLHLRGANRDGVAALNELTLPVEVLPAWHQTWWAYLLYSAALLAFAHGLYRWRVRKLERNRAMLQEQVYSRTRHLEQLNAIVKSINEQLDFDALLQTILQESSFIKGSDAAWALVRDAGSDRLTLRAAWERNGTTPAEHELTLDEANTRYVSCADAIAADIYVTGPGRTRAHPSSTLLAVRIGIDLRIEGYLVFEKRTPPMAFASDDLDLIKALKEPFVSAFQKANSLHLIEQERASAEAANRAKSEFLTNISHEIRTPINAILGFAGLGSHLELPAKPLDYFRKIGRAGQSLLGIINDVLDFSKIESGKLELETVPFDLAESLSQIADLFSWRAAEKDLELVVWATPGVPPILTGDPLRLNQVLVNLVGNALKFTSHGHIELRVELDSAHPDNVPDKQVRLRFSVEDSGVGISAEQQARLFMAFAQADASTTRLYGGTGLGLAISQELVGKMGGTIRVESTPGQGSRFEFAITLPTSPVHDARQLEARGGARGKRVLIVDDSAPTRAMLEAQLRSFGFQADAVGSGEAALFALQLEPYDAVLMDWNMPRMDGIETARRIRADGEIARIPAIIMVTAYARDNIRNAAETAGIDGFLVKPVTPLLLLDGVLQALGHEATLATPSGGALPFGHAEIPAIGGTRVLVVDDNSINQQVASEILQRAGVVVELASSGAEALELLASTQFDAVLMDIQMPEMDGYQATQRIRAIERLAALPVIAMTAHAMSGYRERCLAMGMNDYITKPIEPGTLFTTLAKWVPARTGAAALAVVPALPAMAEELAPLPHLPGIDVRTALARLGGKRELLQRLLTMFAQEFAGAMEQLQAAVARDDLDEAAQLAHKLKGAAGNLAANDLHLMAGEVEYHLMAHKRSALAQLIPALVLTFDLVMESARSQQAGVGAETTAGAT